MSLAAGLKRIKPLVPKRVMVFLQHNTRHEPKEAQVLFVNALGEVPEAATASIVVVEGDVETSALVLTTHRMFGVRGKRNQHIFVFTGEVRCDVMSTVPEVLVFFCKGLVARRLACFNGGDGDARVFQHLEAPVIISGGGSCCVTLEDGATLTAKRVCDYIGTSDDAEDFAETSGAQVYEELSELWPEVADALEESEPWELVQEHLDAGTLPF